VSPGDDRQQVVFGVVLATTVAQVGCVTIVVILGALFLGLALDNQFNTRPLFTLVSVLASIPLSLFVLVRVALSATQQLTPSASKEADEEPSDKKE
jgi:F0F1-type ATP synthase assembly protein I